MKKILIYISIYVISLAVVYGASVIIIIIGCGLNDCYSCCIDRFLNQCLPTVDFYVYMNLFATPGMAFFIITDIIDEIKQKRKKVIA